MSRNICLFDLFPSEIIYLIFDYLSSNEILKIFLKLTRKMNKTVSNYNFRQINLKSISKNEFDLICNNLKGKEIKSLILSDDIDTPNQSNLFLKFFSIEELNLYSLTLINVNNPSMEFVGKNLFSLKLMNTHLIKSSNLFGQLKRLMISSEDLFLNLILMVKLEYLTITNQCSFNQFQSLLNNCPNLISLNLNLRRENGEHISIINSKLNRLIINMNCQMNLIEMKLMLNHFPNLIKFQIECRSDLDLCDGYQWEIYLQENLNHLKYFHFKFQLNSTIILNQFEIEKILNSYSSRFWLEEKCWFIAFELGQRLIYSVTTFSCESADQNFRPPIYSTIIDKSIYFDHINALALWEQTNSYFKNVKELWIVDNSSNIHLDLIINLNKIERLIFVSSKNDLTIQILENFISKMKSLYFIQFSSFSLLLNDFKDNYIFNQIKEIKIIKEIKSFSSLELLNKLFPKMQCLNIQIKSIEEMKFILKFFSKCLSLVKFDFDPSLFPSLTQKSFEKMLGHSNFTCAFHPDSIRLWIGSDQDSNQTDFQETKNARCFSWCSIK